MQIVIIAGFMIALVTGQMPMATSSPWLVFLAMVAYLAGAAVLGRVDAVLYLRAARREGCHCRKAIRRHAVASAAARVWLLGGLAGLMLLGYGHHLGLLAAVPLAAKAAAVAPFLLGVVLVWMFDYPVHRAMRTGLPSGAPEPPPRPVWTAGQYLAYNVRHHLLTVAVPVGLIIMLSDSLAMLVPRLVGPGAVDYVSAAATAAGALCVFLLAPLLIVRIWKTESLPAGELRSLMEATCRRLNLTYRDILLWKSDGVVANAAVMGVVAPTRYILISDALIEQTDSRDIESIFAHEAGHIMYHHIFYSVLFTVAVVNACVLAGHGLTVAVSGPVWLGDIIVLALMAAIWPATFGWVSRRFERQSDVTAAWASGHLDEGDDPDLVTHQGAAVFARALQRICDLNGIPAERRSWRHGSAAGRISYVLWLGSTGRTRRLDGRLVRRIKMATWAIFGVGVVAIVATAVAGWL